MSAREDFGTERHADPLDAATDNALMENQSHLEVARKAVAPERTLGEHGQWIYQVEGEDGSFPHTQCVEEDCGDDLPRLRMEMGRIRCVDCQTKREKRRA